VGNMEQLPSMFDFVTNRLLDRQIYKTSPNSIIVNEYEAGQGIMPHVDAPKLFGPTITALSLLSDCVMAFQHVKDPSLIYRVHLRKSLSALSTAHSHDYNLKRLDLAWCGYLSSFHLWLLLNSTAVIGGNERVLSVRLQAQYFKGSNRGCGWYRDYSSSASQYHISRHACRQPSL
jgi:hypothetical protein